MAPLWPSILSSATFPRPHTLIAFVTPSCRPLPASSLSLWALVCPATHSLFVCDHVFSSFQRQLAGHHLLFVCAWYTYPRDSEKPSRYHRSASAFSVLGMPCSTGRGKAADFMPRDKDHTKTGSPTFARTPLLISSRSASSISFQIRMRTIMTTPGRTSEMHVVVHIGLLRMEIRH